MSQPQTTSPRHPWERLFDELTGRMGVKHAFGTEDEAKSAPFNRVVWVPQDIGFADASFTPEYAQATQFLEGNFKVRIFGASPIRVYQLVASLAGWVDLLVGPAQGDPESEDKLGYRLGKASGPIGGTLNEGTWYSDVPITLRDFVIRAYTPPATIQSAGVRVDAADATGSEQAIPNLDG